MEQARVKSSSYLNLSLHYTGASLPPDRGDLMTNPAHCGIDVGLRTHAICLADRAGDVIEEFTITNDRAGFTTLCRKICKRTKCAMEPTGVYSINLYLFLARRGYDVRFVETRSSHHFRRARSRYQKADRKDAVALAKYRLVNEDLSHPGERYVERLLAGTKTADQRQLWALLRDYVGISSQLRRVRSRIKLLIDLRFPEADQLFRNRGATAICRLLSHTREDILAGRVREASPQMRTAVRLTIGQFDMFREEFVELADRQRALEDALERRRDEIEAFVRAMGWDCLLSLPAVGPVTAAALVTQAVPVRRFVKLRPDGRMDKKASVRGFKAFCGLAVSRHQSGTHEGGQRLSAGGNRVLKNMLFTMARTFLSMTPARLAAYRDCPLRPDRYRAVYVRHRERGKKGMEAVVKMMDKIATDLFFALLDAERVTVARGACEGSQSKLDRVLLPRVAPA